MRNAHLTVIAFNFYCVDAYVHARMQRFILLLALPCLCSAVDVTEVVDTKYGQVQGRVMTLHTGMQVNAFLGIPFAKPPVGSLRFKVR